MTGFSPFDFLSVGFSIYPGQQLGLRRIERRAIVLKVLARVSLPSLHSPR